MRTLYRAVLLIFLFIGDFDDFDFLIRFSSYLFGWPAIPPLPFSQKMVVEQKILDEEMSHLLTRLLLPEKVNFSFYEVFLKPGSLVLLSKCFKFSVKCCLTLVPFFRQKF